MKQIKLAVIGISVVMLTAISVQSSAQENKKDQQTIETKMDKFISKTGAFVKFVDNKLPRLEITYGSAETRIRRVINGEQTFYFYQIDKTGLYSRSIASIEYSDLLEIIKALDSLVAEVDKDVASNPDYLENKFITVDGFQIGYFVSKGKSTWYIKLEQHGTENTLLLESAASIGIALDGAKSKIEELKK